MKYMNLFGKTVVSVAVLAAFGGANAATGRAGVVGGTNTSRMPVMPVVSLNTIGNPAVQTLGQSSGGPSGLPTINPNPNPGPNIDPTPDDGCEGGGVRNSSYTVAMCMDDLLQCVNTGALQGGINDLFNADVRNSIMSGMRLCQNVVDKCIREVRLDCRNVYAATTDVWLDFNSRVIQPEYYNFVLRKTGLTPNQAENTCLLLDRNTYGESFASVSDANVVNTEYNNYVGAYNRQMNNTLSKENPQGVKVNDTGYDGNRGHYARWDAAKAECLLRVAAYNKDNLITNSWLFGAIGDDNPAEVWQKTGSTFTCSKDLFDFSLLNKTKTTAVLGVGGGTVLGTAIGAAAGAGAYNKKSDAANEAENNKYNDPCEDDEYRKKLAYQITHETHNKDVLSIYLYDGVTIDDKGNLTQSGKTVDINYDKLSKDHCKKINDLYSKIKVYETAVDFCQTDAHMKEITKKIKVDKIITKTEFKTSTENGSACLQTETNCGFEEREITEYISKCLFKPLALGFSIKNNNSPLCNNDGHCVDVNEISSQISQLHSILSEIEPAIDKNVLAKSNKPVSKGAEIGKGAAIGAVTGAGVGGIVTGITALVERSNITCKVGDGLNSVSLGKSHTIDSLKDFYVKWNLKLPDTVAPTALVSDRASWQQACSQFNSRLMDCPYVQVNLQTAPNSGYTLVNAACVQSGSVCTPNEATMSSHGIQ